MRHPRLAIVIAAALAAVALWPALATPRGALRVLAWPDAFGPHTLSDFRLSTGIQVEVETVASAEALLSRVAGGFDLALVPDYLIPMLGDRELLLPLDHSRLHHLGDIEPRLAGRPEDPGHLRSVPFSWGTTGIAWRADRVARPPVSFAEALDPAAPWAGHLLLVADARESLGAALKAVGASANSVDPQEIAAARDLLIGRPSLSVRDGASAPGRLAFGAAWVSLAWSDDLSRLRRRGHHGLGFAVPEEGGILWLDAFVLLATSRDPDAAHRFLDYLGHPRTAAAIAAARWRASPSVGARALMPRELLADPIACPPARLLDRSEFLRDVGAATALYDAAWDQVLRAAGARERVR